MTPLTASHRRHHRAYRDPIKVLVAVAMLLALAVLLILFANGVGVAQEIPANGVLANCTFTVAARADVSRKAMFPGVAPGTYYLMISTRYNNQALEWDRPVQLKTGETQ